MAVLAPGVVKHLDVIEHIALRMLPGHIDFPLDALALEQLEKALCHRIVMTVAAPSQQSAARTDPGHGWKASTKGEAVQILDQTTASDDKNTSEAAALPGALSLDATAVLLL